MIYGRNVFEQLDIKQSTMVDELAAVLQ